MSTHQSISGRQGKASLKRTNIGPSSSIQALMVKIEWTTAKVVRIEAKKDFILQASTVQVKSGDYKVLAAAPAPIQAGMVLYFVASDEFEGWYYLNMYSEQTGHFNCSCPSGRMRRVCSHQQHAMVYVTHRYTRRVEVEHEIDQDLAAHVEDDLSVEWVTMPNGTKRLASQVNDPCLDSLDKMSEQYAEADRQWQAKQERQYENLTSVA